MWKLLLWLTTFESFFKKKTTTLNLVTVINEVCIHWWNDTIWHRKSIQRKTKIYIFSSHNKSAFYFYGSWVSFYWSYIKLSIAEFLPFRLENKSDNLHKLLWASSRKISKQVDQIHSKTEEMLNDLSRTDCCGELNLDTLWV